MDPLTEQALDGRCQTVGVVRVGNTVRRPLHAWSEYVHAVLEHLASVGFDGAPRLLGIDEQGREMLSFLAGETLPRSPFGLSDARAQSADAVWSCADVCEAAVAVSEQARKVRLMCDAYGWWHPAAVIDEIGDRFRRARDAHARAGRTKAGAVFETMIAWMDDNGPALKSQAARRSARGPRP